MNPTVSTLAAVVFDSGGVLLEHRHGFLDPAVIRAALKDLGAGDIPDKRTAQAVRDALDWLSGQAGGATTEESAAAQRTEYYRRLLAGAGVPASPEMVARLRDQLEGPPSVKPYPEVREVLDALRGRGLKLGVLSDGWASTRRLYEQLGLADRFQSWTFSAVVGCCKPDPRIYAAAEHDLGVEPVRILFVDDLPANIEGALARGWQAVWLNRAGGQPPLCAAQTIRDLRGLLAMV